MSLNVYSPMKPAWHLDRLTAIREGLHPRPVHAHLILSDLCNQDCSFCAYRLSTGLSNELFVGESEVAKIGTNNPKRQIPVDRAIELVEDCAEVGVRAIQFTGGGEPTVHPHHLEVMNRAQQLGMETALVTNGVKLDPYSPVIRAHKWIRVSVDAGTPETYSKVRRVPEKHWTKVWQNITALADGYEGVLGVGFVVTPDNYKEVEQAAILARAAGAQNIRVGAVFSREGLNFYGGKIEEIAHVVQYVKKTVSAVGSFEVFDQFGLRINDLESGSPTEKKCYYQHFTLYIGGDQWLYRCCVTGYTTAGRVADLSKVRLRDAFPFAYEPFDARQCQYCQFQGQNKAIAALVHEPTHINFV